MAKRRVDETQTALDDLPPKGTGTKLHEERRKALEELKKRYDEELEAAKKALEALGEVVSALESGRESLDGILAALEARDADLRGRTFEDAGRRILVMIDRHRRSHPFPPPPRGRAPASTR